MTQAKPRRSKVVRAGKLAAKAFLITAVGIIAILLVGLIPVNNQFRPTADGVKIYVISNAVHADIVVPIANEVHDWNGLLEQTQFTGNVAGLTHVAFGWGDKGFYLETETWADFKFSTAANALLLPSASCMHVTMTRPEYLADKVAVTISKEEYARLAAFIDSSFAKNEHKAPVQIPGYAYWESDAFFEAVGSYHFFNTCNSWVGRALKRGGIRVPLLSSLPKTPMLYISTEEP